MNLSRCTSCGATIWWARTTTGKRMPVDATPVEGGNVVLVDDSDDSPLVDVISAKQAALPGFGLVARATPRYTSHFATCPDADRHRKPRPRRASGS